MVTTPIGHEGLETIADEHLLVASDAAGFADTVVRLCRDRTLRLRFGREGREVVERSYGWSHSAELLVNLYGELAARSPVVQ